MTDKLNKLVEKLESDLSEITIKQFAEDDDIELPRLHKLEAGWEHSDVYVRIAECCSAKNIGDGTALLYNYNDLEKFFKDNADWIALKVETSINNPRQRMIEDS